MKLIYKDNCYPNLIRNKGEYEDLHISRHSLDEMYAGIPGTSAKIFMPLLVLMFKNNLITDL
jgi:hypothetical protein